MKCINFQVTLNSVGYGYFAYSTNVSGEIKTSADNLKDLLTNLESEILNYYTLSAINNLDIAWELDKGWKYLLKIPEIVRCKILDVGLKEDIIVLNEWETLYDNVTLSFPDQFLSTVDFLDIEETIKDESTDERLMMYLDESEIFNKTSILKYLGIDISSIESNEDLVKLLKFHKSESEKFNLLKSRIKEIVSINEVPDLEIDEFKEKEALPLNTLMSIGEETASLLGYL